MSLCAIRITNYLKLLCRKGKLLILLSDKLSMAKLVIKCTVLKIVFFFSFIVKINIKIPFIGIKLEMHRISLSKSETATFLTTGK